MKLLAKLCLLTAADVFVLWIATASARPDDSENGAIHNQPKYGQGLKHEKKF